MSDIEFEKFPKIARLNRDIVITEKIDGTNAQVFVTEDYKVRAGSRNRWLTVEEDNFGFARWVKENEDELSRLGPGRHFGEWWGAGIQRKYGLDHKRFSLFNTYRWNDETKPKCCDVVPVLYKGVFSHLISRLHLNSLEVRGSVAAPGFHKPEGIIIWHEAAQQSFKVTIEDDEAPKSVKGAA